MDPRERWQALQGRLTAARAAVDAGNTAAALSEITAALELDKDFLAAQALRDRILATNAAPETPPSVRRLSAPRPLAPPAAVSAAAVVGEPPRTARPVEAPLKPTSTQATPVEAASKPVAAPPSQTAVPVQVPEKTSTPAVRVEAASKPVPDTPVMPAGFVKFEQRARRRRVDRRIDAARAALDDRRVRAAASALDEVIDLDPNLPELVELTARFDELRRATGTHRRGPWVFAAGVFGIAIFGASWLQDSAQVIASRRMSSAAPLLMAVAPPVTIAERLAVADTPDEPTRAAAPAPVEPRLRVPDPPLPPAPRVAARVVTPVESPSPVRVAAPIESSSRVRVAETARTTPEPPAPPPAAAAAPSPVAAAAPIPPSADAPDDSRLVRRVLQRYRTAYDGLDARSAREVWPAVNQAALARAFDGLQSQSLTFDACDVKLRGEAATATCRGSARYVTKFGSRDPRVESLVWNFTLHKTGSDWQIDSARAER
jgi:hypothetical protein